MKTLGVNLKVNGFREMDARVPTHELYLTQNLDRLLLMERVFSYPRGAL
jgi:hypothetical protein